MPGHLLGVNVDAPFWFRDESGGSHNGWLGGYGDLDLGLIHWGLYMTREKSSFFRTRLCFPQHKPLLPQDKSLLVSQHKQ